MTGFSVQPAAVRRLAQQLDRAREDINATRQHLTKMRDFEGGEGLIGQLTGGHRDAYRTLDEWLSRLAEPSLSSVGKAMDDSATYYVRTDHATEAKLDARYPAADAAGQRKKTGYVTGDGSPIEFQDVQEPRGRLNDIKDYHAKLNGTYDWWDAASPMTAIGAALEGVSHVAAWLELIPRPIDPWEEIVKPWVGDWAGLRAAADVLHNVRWAVSDVGINIQWASQGSQEVWQGNAGDAAAVHLMKLVKPCEEAHGPIGDLAEQYRTASEEMIALRDAVVNILKAVGDAAIEAAASAVAAGGSVSTGVGIPLGILAGAFSAYNIYRVADGITEILELIGRMDTILKAVAAAQTNYGSLHHAGNPLPALPDTPLATPR